MATEMSSPAALWESNFSRMTLKDCRFLEMSSTRMSPSLSLINSSIFLRITAVSLAVRSESAVSDAR